jgi:hypothetical protein
MSLPRPTLRNVPEKIAFNQHFTVQVDIPKDIPHSADIKGPYSHPFEDKLL